MLLVGCPLGMVKLLLILGGQPEKLAGWSLPQLTHFGGVPKGFVQSLDECGWSHLTHLDGLPQKLEE
jgi:hypothetical protein